MVRSGVILCGVFLIALSFSGCSALTSHQDPEVEKPIEVYQVANRQLPPKQVYNRLRWVHLPQPLPEKVGAVPTESYILPIVQLELEDATLQEAVDALAATTSYQSYCENRIANKKITIKALGTIDELVEKISKEAGILAEVDHDTQSIRFMK